ncbi:MAG: hypothetical protein NZ853_05645 [Leptospiraceae bacterium]|nr:hypothetical protein [Leptospiraceae bacterium]
MMLLESCISLRDFLGIPFLQTSKDPLEQFQEDEKLREYKKIYQQQQEKNKQNEKGCFELQKQYIQNQVTSKLIFCQEE